ncbi:MAG: type II toxin-antitoxin system VapC family toxin [Fibrobacteres bacterium]|nr:type II toxin-antitoxin system VapC family toxin [Fibrobacterota bacterium]
MKLFFDTSAFIKRYIEEAGSSEIESLCGKADDVAVSMLLPVEAVSAITRLHEEKKITVQQMKAIKSALFSDIKDITLVQLSTSAITFSIRTIESSHIKTLDAVHIGCAMEYVPDYFVTSDKQQAVSARKAGLQVKYI